MADPRRPRLIGYLNELDVTGPSAVADDLLAHLDLVDPLRALLADEDRALLLFRRAIADPAQFLQRAGYGTPDAETITSWSARALLAALREVAGLTHCAACHRPLPHTAPELAACQTAREVADGG